MGNDNKITLEIFFGDFGIWVEREGVSGCEHLGPVDADSDLGVFGLHLVGFTGRHVTQELAHFLQMVHVLLETLAALVEPVAVQRNGRRSQVTHQVGVLAGRGQQLGRLFQGRLLQLQPQFLRALQ